MSLEYNVEHLMLTQCELRASSANVIQCRGLSVLLEFVRKCVERVSQFWWLEICCVKMWVCFMHFI